MLPTQQRPGSTHWKAQRVDLSALLEPPRAPESEPRRCDTFQRKDVSDHLDHELLKHARATLEGGPPTMLTRSVSTRTSSFTSDSSAVL